MEPDDRAAALNITIQDVADFRAAYDALKDLGLDHGVEHNMAVAQDLIFDERERCARIVMASAIPMVTRRHIAAAIRDGKA